MLLISFTIDLDLGQITLIQDYDILYGYMYAVFVQSTQPFFEAWPCDDASSQFRDLDSHF